MEFGVKLKKLRTEKGISQQALADAVYVSRSAVAKWENGLGLPSRDSLDALLAFFEIEESFFATEQAETVIVKKNRRIYLLYAVISFVCVVVLLFSGFLCSRYADTVKTTDKDAIMQQMVAYLSPALKRDGYAQYKSVSIVDMQIRGDYMAVLAKTDGEFWCLCLFERDRIFHNRWYPGGGIPYFAPGMMTSLNIGGSDGTAVLVFCCGEPPKDARWYTFENDGIEYLCPVENNFVLDLFVIPDQNNIRGFPVLLNAEKQEIETPRYPQSKKSSHYYFDNLYGR